RPVTTADTGKPAATKMARQRVAATAGHWASTTPKAAGKASTAQAGAPAPAKALHKAQASTQVSKAGKGQLRVSRRSMARKARGWARASALRAAQLVDQAVELVERAELDGDLALLAALGAALHVDLH